MFKKNSIKNNTQQENVVKLKKNNINNLIKQNTRYLKKHKRTTMKKAYNLKNINKRQN